MNRSDLRTRILDGLNESATSPVFWSTTEIDGLINEAQEIICEELEAVKRTVVVPLRDGQLYFFTQAIAPDIMAPYRLYTTHNNRRLVATTVGELDRRHELWARVEGDPKAWASIGWDTFVTYPHVADGGGTLRVDYIAWPRTLLDDDDEPEIPEDHQEGLIIYGVYDGLMKQWDSQRGAQMFQLFMQKFTKVKADNLNRVMARTWQVAAQPGGRFRNAGNSWAQ